MATNGFGSIFRITTFGESHGPGVGVVIDGCPAGVPLDEHGINEALAKRAPGNSRFTSPRKERDQVKLLSGVFQGLSTGAHIALFIENIDAEPEKYSSLAHICRPGHANTSYLHKYGVFDFHGGGRASARETAARVAAGAVAKQLLKVTSIRVTAFLAQVGAARAPEHLDILEVHGHLAQSELFCPDSSTEVAFSQEISKALAAKDSVGGVVSYYIEGVPPGLGDPVYGKLHAVLASALLSIPAAKGFEIGAGFAAAAMRGSACNDTFFVNGGAITLATNHAGGVLGGIATGDPIYGKVAFKPTPSIGLEQHSVTLSGEPATLRLPEGSRHDPCVAVRAVPVVEAMCFIALADLFLLNRCAKL